MSFTLTTILIYGIVCLFSSVSWDWKIAFLIAAISFVVDIAQAISNE